MVGFASCKPANVLVIKTFGVGILLKSIPSAPCYTMYRDDEFTHSKVTWVHGCSDAPAERPHRLFCWTDVEQLMIDERCSLHACQSNRWGQRVVSWSIYTARTWHMSARLINATRDSIAVYCNRPRCYRASHWSSIDSITSHRYFHRRWN